MNSYPIRDQKRDHLITPENTTLVIIDYQPAQVASIASMDKNMLVKNITLLCDLAKIFHLPVILSTVNANANASNDTLPEIRSHLEGVVSYDRTTINAWEDKEFQEAVKSTGRKKLIMTALWTEACLSFPSLNALKEGFDVYPVVDCVGGTSVIAHQTALRRIEQAGGQLTRFAQLACELQRDWNRKNTSREFIELMKAARIFS